MSLNNADTCIDALTAYFADLGIEAGYLVPTPTGLRKCTLDATAPVRDYLRRMGIHDYASQGRGKDAKRSVPATLMLPDSTVHTTATLIRPKSGNGDPRVWFRHLKTYCKPHDVLAVLAHGGALYVVNGSDATLLASGRHAATPLGMLLASMAEAGGFDMSNRSTAAGSSETAFDRLCKREFGGSDVAARPGAEDDAWWPKGAALPGVREVTAAFVAATRDAKGLTLAFLLGGAGNGKSYAARELASALGAVFESTNGLAQRSYTTKIGGTHVEVLNDATIAPSEAYPGKQDMALAVDVERWIALLDKGPVAVFCCVNRGIIYDELRALSLSGQGRASLSHGMLRWLSSGAGSLSTLLNATQQDLQRSSLGVLSPIAHLRHETVLLGKHPVSVAALAVDTVSLMAADTPGAPSRGAALLREVVNRCATDAMARPSECPIRANVTQLLNATAQAHWLKFLQASEIASGRPHSYRELWGITALSILGPRTQDRRMKGAVSDVDSHLDGTSTAASIEDRLPHLLALARHRTHEAVFRAPYLVLSDDHISLDFPPPTPAHGGLIALDPSVWGFDHSRQVEDAMQAMAVGARPSEHLPHKEALASCWSPFDEALERAIVEYVCTELRNDVDRRTLTAWWSGYLCRLLALATGCLGNERIVEAWQDAATRCESGPAALPNELEIAIKQLLVPPRQGGHPGHVLIPAFAGRAEPVVAVREGAPPLLAECVDTSAVQLRLASHGGRLHVQCHFQGQHVSDLMLDFAMLREVSAFHAGQAGQTEATAFVEPRIERARAAALQRIPEISRRLVVLHGNDETEVMYS